MIKVVCTTNLDDYRHTLWPTVMATLPNKGDRVRSQSGKTLKVVGITHSERLDGQPIVEIELSI
jgi:hypothetical protein